MLGVAINNSEFLKTVNVLVVWGRTRKANTVKSLVLSFPVRLQFRIKSKVAGPFPSFNCSLGRQEALSLSVCLNWLISDLSHLQLWGRACGVLPFDDVSVLECNVVTWEIASDDFPLKGKLWIPADHLCWSGERTEIQRGRQSTRKPCHPSFVLLRLLCSSVSCLYPLD